MGGCISQPPPHAPAVNTATGALLSTVPHRTDSDVSAPPLRTIHETNGNNHYDQLQQPLHSPELAPPPPPEVFPDHLRSSNGSHHSSNLGASQRSIPPRQGSLRIPNSPTGQDGHESSQNLDHSHRSSGSNHYAPMPHPPQALPGPPPTPMIPEDPRFTSSTNGRNGWKFEQIYTSGVELGHGAFGAVFSGTHKFASSHPNGSLEPEWKNVAIKKTTPNALDLRGGREISTYDQLEERCQEIKTLLRLQSGSPVTTNVLYLYEYFMAGKDFYMVTERLGQELDDWRQQCELFTEKNAIEICRTILQSLAFCESRKVVHRDIKLQNILFRENGNFRSLKLVDFGLACALEDGQSARDFCGSIGYIAPEIYQGKPYRYEVDMFAFGVLLFRLLSGERPFPSNNSQILKRHTVELRYNVLGQDWASVSSSAKDLVRKLLINRHERLTAERALKHKWFSEMGESVLRADRSSAVFRNTADTSRSRAVVRTHVPPASVERGDGSRFWMDSEVEYGLATIMSYDIYSGQVVERSNNVDSTTNVLMCIQETVPPICTTVPDFIAQLPTYTEKDCRAICLQLAKCIDILHTAGIAHRNLHLDNVLIDFEGKVSIKGLMYAQPIRANQPMTGHFGYLYSWFAFKAPEVDSEFVHDESVDLWSLGAVICFLLTGLPPFRGTAMELVDAKKYGHIKFDVAIPSEPAQNLVRGLLKVNPSERFTIEQVLNHEWMVEADDYLDKFGLDVAYSFLNDWRKV